MAKVDKILAGLLSLFCVVLVNCDKVPVLIWNDKIEHSLPKSLAGHSVSEQDFKTSYLDEIAKKKHNLVLFLQDKLSVNDISKYADVYNEQSNGDTFRNLKSLMESYGSTHLPSVDLPESTLSALKDKFAGKVHEITEDYTTKNVPLQNQDNLVLVHLPKTGNSDEKYQNSLAKIDGIIGKVSEELKSSGTPFTALYTSRSNSHIAPESLNVGRHLLADTTSPLINISNCVYVFVRDMKLNIDSSNWTLPTDPALATGTCANNSATLNWNFGNVGDGLTKLDMKVTFFQDLKYYTWRIGNWTINYSGTNQTTQESFSSEGDQFLNARLLTAPLTFSYACGNSQLQAMNATGGSGTAADVRLNLYGIQMQAFNIRGNMFGRDNNCVGFFDVQTWSMLVALFVLIIVLVPGVQMVASVRVMDRFDDPKGKTISVTQGD